MSLAPHAWREDCIHCVPAVQIFKDLSTPYLRSKSPFSFQLPYKSATFSAMFCYLLFLQLFERTVIIAQVNLYCHYWFTCLSLQDYSTLIFLSLAIDSHIHSGYSVNILNKCISNLMKKSIKIAVTYLMLLIRALIRLSSDGLINHINILFARFLHHQTF